MDISTLITRAAAEYGDAVAVREAATGRSRSYASLVDSARRLARGLHQAGLEPGDRVGILAKNSIEWVTTSVGLAFGGFVQFPLRPGADAEDIRARLDQVGARAVIADHDLLGVWGEHVELVVGICPDDIAVAPAKLDRPGLADFADLLIKGSDLRDHVEPGSLADAPFCIRFTSGSTSVPKGVVHTHRQYGEVMSNQLHVRNWGLYFGRDDTFLQFLPLESAMQFLYSCLLAGTETLLLDTSGPAPVADLLRRYPVTMTFGAPPALATLLTGIPSEELHLRTVFYGGATMSPALEGELRQRFGDVLVHLYAASEFPGCTVTRRRGENASEDGSCGRPGFGVECRVIDETGATTPPGVVGEIEIRGHHVFAGYWDNPNATAASLSAEGWARVGDLAYLDETGSVHIVDRRQNQIEVNGRVIYPSVLERSLASVEVGLEIVVDVSEEDGAPKVVVICHLVPADDARRQRVRDRLTAELAELTNNISVVFASEPLPKSPVGKILRKLVIADHDATANV